MRVLVVDDEPAVRSTLNRALVLEGYAVDLAADGWEALSRLTVNSPDAIVLDTLMPGVDGLEVCRRLRTPGREHRLVTGRCPSTSTGCRFCVGIENG